MRLNHTKNLVFKNTRYPIILKTNWLCFGYYQKILDEQMFYLFGWVVDKEIWGVRGYNGRQGKPSRDPQTVYL